MKTIEVNGKIYYLHIDRTKWGITEKFFPILSDLLESEEYLTGIMKLTENGATDEMKELYTIGIMSKNQKFLRPLVSIHILDSNKNQITNDELDEIDPKTVYEVLNFFLSNKSDYGMDMLTSLKAEVSGKAKTH